MLVRFHLSTGAVLDAEVPNMNEIGHVSNTLAKFGRVYINDFKGAILKEHVVYMEEFEVVDDPEEVHGPYYADNEYDSKAEQEGMQHNPITGAWS